jgi:hypothetical protein
MLAPACCYWARDAMFRLGPELCSCQWVDNSDRRPAEAPINLESTSSAACRTPCASACSQSMSVMEVVQTTADGTPGAAQRVHRRHWLHNRRFARLPASPRSVPSTDTKGEIRSCRDVERALPCECCDGANLASCEAGWTRNGYQACCCCCPVHTCLLVFSVHSCVHSDCCKHCCTLQCQPMLRPTCMCRLYGAASKHSAGVRPLC